MQAKEHVKQRLSLVVGGFNETQLQVTFPDDQTGQTQHSFCATLGVYGYDYEEVKVDNKVMSVIVTNSDPVEARFMVLGTLLLVLGKQPTLNDYRHRVNIFSVDDQRTWEINLYKCVSHYLDQEESLQPWQNIIKAIKNTLTDAHVALTADLANYTKDTGCKPITTPAVSSVPFNHFYAVAASAPPKPSFRNHEFYACYKSVQQCKVVFQDLAAAKGIFKLFGKAAKAEQRVENISEKLLVPYSALVDAAEKNPVPSLG